MAVIVTLSVLAFGGCHSKRSSVPPPSTTTGPSATSTTGEASSTTLPAGDFVTRYGFDGVRAQLVQNGFIDGEAFPRSGDVLVLRLHFQGRDGASDSRDLVDSVAPGSGLAQATAVSRTTLIVVRAPDAATAQRVANDEAGR